jgi:hypothetical protein
MRDMSASSVPKPGARVAEAKVPGCDSAMGQGSVPAQSVLGAQTQGMLGYLIEQEPGNQLGNVREAYLDGEAGFENTASVW